MAPIPLQTGAWGHRANTQRGARGLSLIHIYRDQDFHSLSASLSTYAQPLGRAEDGIAVPTGTAKNLDMTTGGSIRWVGVLKPPPVSYTHLDVYKRQWLP